MPVRICYVQGNKQIGELETEINKWQNSLSSKATVTHISTAMTEHEEVADTNDSNDLVRAVDRPTLVTLIAGDSETTRTLIDGLPAVARSSR